ncbi:MAG: polysaccharide pyruvyl transferase family protein [Verrucomicrobiales bacterium]|nr:polysaccharide pyruvyl transferase family protein [Verrucomicrobiales bacterium]
MLGILRAGLFYARSPQRAVDALKRHYYTQTQSQVLKPESLLRPAPGPAKRDLMHVAAFTAGNAGDHLLPVALRDLFDSAGGRSRWTLRHAHPVFDATATARANAARGLIIGGGGLFLRDTNRNANSGWQWNCPLDQLRKIQAPLVVFAVGYNRFRGQPDFDPIFREHLAAVAQQSVYLGLRNHGSIEAIRGYLPEALRSKVRFQPCMTTVLGCLYPFLQTHRVPNPKPVIVLNAAFDRAELRFGRQESAILTAIAQAVAELGRGADIHLAVHVEDDAHIMPFLRSEGVEFTKIDLRRATPKGIAEYYAVVDLVLGMRGHAQMIPFGCGTPLLSLISHDKLRWFLDDIQRPEWGVEVHHPDLREVLVSKARDLLLRAEEVRADIARLREYLWKLSCKNVEDALQAIDTPR